MGYRRLSLHLFPPFIRPLTLIFTISLFFFSLPNSLYAGPKVAVYYGTTASVKDREQMLKSRLGTNDVLVFARSRDFFQTIEQEQVPIIIAPYITELNQSNYEPVLQTLVAGSKTFHYKIVSLADKKIDPTHLDAIVFGMIEDFERQKLKTFFKDNVGLNLSKINTVPKAEDLFPLLVFSAADAIAVSEDNYSRLLKLFNAKTAEVQLNTLPIPYPRIYLRKGQDSDLIKKIEQLSTMDLNILGFDGVERISK